MVDRRVLLQQLEAGHELCRGRFQPAHMSEQEEHRGLLVFRVIGCTGVLVFLERLLDLFGKLGQDLLLTVNKKRNRCRAGGKDKVLEALWLGGSELCRKYGTPRMAHKVEIFVDLEMSEEVVEFGDEELDGPEVMVSIFLSKMGGFPAADLVVEDDRDLVFGPEIGEGDQIVVGKAGTSVKDH